MTTALPLATIPAVELEQLNSSAELLTRKDRKYVVGIDLAARLVVQQGLRVLEIDGLRTFRYESVYFDTPNRVSYRAAAHKRRRRFKVRTRSYLDSGLCSLEVKTRERRGLTAKHRLPYSVLLRHELTAGAREFIDGFERVSPPSGELSPSLVTRYGRTTLLSPTSNSRITVDTELECETPDGRRISLPDLAIVETKTSGRPCSTDRFLWDAHERPVKISKYGAGLAALTPGLPANKWNRVLRTYFGWVPADSG
ncbi:MAG: polyphosphate polymerase domain-containing protein [Acidimicrobiia bacterium]|nr:polyphosphate polymerase domain-containing protein [Acidimicrobiia bacterium]